MVQTIGTKCVASRNGEAAGTEYGLCGQKPWDRITE